MLLVSLVAFLLLFVNGNSRVTQSFQQFDMYPTESDKTTIPFTMTITCLAQASFNIIEMNADMYSGDIKIAQVVDQHFNMSMHPNTTTTSQLITANAILNEETVAIMESFEDEGFGNVSINATMMGEIPAFNYAKSEEEIDQINVIVYIH